MPSLKEIRNRVRTVKNTQKITRAMKLVAAAKLRRAQEGVEAARPYASKLREVIGALVADADDDAHPYFVAYDEPSRALYVAFTSDRGLCGGFNSSLIRHTLRTLREQDGGYDELGVAAVGKKGRGAFARAGRRSERVSFAEVPALADADVASKMAATLGEAFTKGDVQEVYLVYNEFISALTQEVVIEQLLPLTTDSFEDAEEGKASDALLERIWEPDRASLLESLVPKYIENRIYRAMLESVASEQGARMTAMDNATSNATDLIDNLTLSMNRARQAIITTELMEITSGAESLKG